MAEVANDDNILLFQSPRKVISSAVYTLKSPNFFTLTKYDSTYLELCSPTFEFINSSWHFRFQLRESDYAENGDLIKKFSVHLVRLNYEEWQQRIFYEVVLLDSEDKAYVDYGDACVFGSDGEETFLYTFGNDDPSYDSRDTLTLIVHLIYVESTEMDPDKVSDGRSLSGDLKGMLLNGHDHNLTFNVSEKKFQAHQDVLRARSDVFHSMLTHDMLEKNSGVIDVPDCDPEAFEQLLFYIYTGKVETLDENIMFGLYYAADKYNLPDLKIECSKFIKKSLSNTNVCDAIQLGTKHSDNGLLNSAMDYFFSNVDDILLTVEWQIFIKMNPTVANELFIRSLKKIREAQAS